MFSTNQVLPVLPLSQYLLSSFKRITDARCQHVVSDVNKSYVYIFFLTMQSVLGKLDIECCILPESEYLIFT